MAKFTKNQPQDGDMVVHCGHIKSNNLHFFMSIKGISFFRPDTQSQEVAHWVVACNDCFHAADGNPQNLNLCGSATWIGDEPEVIKNPDRPEEYKGKLKR